MDKRLIILGGVAAAAFFIMKKKASADTGAALPTGGGTAAPESSNVLSSWLNGLNNLITKPAPAPSPTSSPAPAPTYDNSVTSPAPAPAPSPWTGNGGGSANTTSWDEALNRLIFTGSGGGYIDYNTGIRHYNDGSSNKVGAFYLDRFKEEALGTAKTSSLGFMLA